MPLVMAVSFTRYGRLYYLDPGSTSPSVGDKVLVPTDAGAEVAECVWAPQWVNEEVGGLPVCAGMAGEDDLARDERNRSRRTSARSTAKRLIRRHELPMKVVAVDYLDAEEKVVVYFTAPHRVDFRVLVRELAADLKARVDLRQLGPRDEARVQGGIGPCGRDLCCATFLKDFEAVSVRMVRDQDLPLNPLKISGACGRLMCWPGSAWTRSSASRGRRSGRRWRCFHRSRSPWSRRLPRLRRPVEPDPRRVRRGGRSVRARGAPERDRVRLLDHGPHPRGARPP